MTPPTFCQKYNLYNQRSSNYFSLSSQDQREETQKPADRLIKDHCFKLQLYLSLLHISCKQPPASK